LVYKRSRDHGKSWSALSVFTQDPTKRAENGLCQSQAAPVIDPVTKTLFVGFTANLPGCIAPALGAKAYKSTVMLVKSLDDGEPLPLFQLLLCSLLLDTDSSS
jgi:hypothetical protein